MPDENARPAPVITTALISGSTSISSSARRAVKGDVDAITVCVENAYSMYIPRLGKPPGPMLDSYSELIAPSRHVFVVETDGAVIGVLVLGEVEGVFFLENVAVDPGHQGRGVGKALLQRAEIEARQRRFCEIHLYTNVVMVENEALYRKIGYTEYGRRAEGGFSRIYMKKSLT
jgi:ribosomal protein S18 acetylase RimI-like enzyme